jgi:hypothetical protein
VHRAQVVPGEHTRRRRRPGGTGQGRGEARRGEAPTRATRTGDSGRRRAHHGHRSHLPAHVAAARVAAHGPNRGAVAAEDDPAGRVVHHPESPVPAADRAPVTQSVLTLHAGQSSAHPAKSSEANDVVSRDQGPRKSHGSPCSSPAVDDACFCRSRPPANPRFQFSLPFGIDLGFISLNRQFPESHIFSDDSGNARKGRQLNCPIVRNRTP